MYKSLSLGAALLLGVHAVPLSCQAAPAATPSWISRSDDASRILLDATGPFSPEDASDYGDARFDARVADLGPGTSERQKKALLAARSELERRLRIEQDENTRQDLHILIGQIDLQVEGIDLDDNYMLPFVDVGQLVFNGEFVLLKDEVAKERRPAALKRLECYAGLTPGCTPITKLAEAQTEARLENRALLGPFRDALTDQLDKRERYVAGIRKLFETNHLAGAGPALDAIDRQLRDYDDWARQTVLPRARMNFRLPEAEYAHHLKVVGLNVDPHDLVRQAMVEFAETRSAMQVLAPVVAKAEGILATDYRDVLKALKARQLEKSSVLPTYRRVIAQVESTIRKQGIVTLPKREMVVRMASDAESAAIAAPHMDPPAFIGNKGERGTFVLTSGHQGRGSKQMYDDFTYGAATWTLTAHEGRPGHELQFAGMLEHGVSQARAVFAFNSVNAEGWGLYSEMEMLPYEPPAGQFVAYQFRLLRAARAFLDPMLNLGMMSRQRAHDVLVQDVGLSEGLARQELDRYMFEYPGQATAYFYGYMRIVQLREATELALGQNFNRRAFNDFLIGQGMLPPDLIAEAVRTQFIPAAKRANQ
jgi:uncharacterized protein (DUF885 family)